MNGLALPRGIESLHRSRCYDPRNRRVPGQSRHGEVLRELIRTPASHLGSVRTIRRLRRSLTRRGAMVRATRPQEAAGHVLLDSAM